MLDTVDLVRRARNLLKATRPVPTIIKHFVREGIGEANAWAVLEEAVFLNLREAVDSVLPLLRERKGGTKIQRTLMMKNGYSWLEANTIFEKARQLWVEEELEVQR